MRSKQLFQFVSLVFLAAVITVPIVPSSVIAQGLGNAARVDEAARREPIPRLRPDSQLDTSDFNAESFFRTFRHATAEMSDGTKLHYVIGGQGEPLVLLHGWPTTWYEWRRMMPALAEQYTVIVPDLRGLGESDKPANSGNKKATADDIYQLCRGLGYDQIFLVGHDWGTSVAFVLAQDHPEFIQRLVLSENMIPGLDIPEVMTFAELNSIPYHHGFHAEPDTPEGVITGRERFYLTNFYKKLTYNWATFTPDVLDEFTRVYSQPGALRASLGFYREVAADDRYVRERGYNTRMLPMPVLVVSGDHGSNNILHLQLRPLIANYRGYVMEHSGHFLPIERPREFTALLKTFFNEERR